MLITQKKNFDNIPSWTWSDFKAYVKNNERTLYHPDFIALMCKNYSLDKDYFNKLDYPNRNDETYTAKVLAEPSYQAFFEDGFKMIDDHWTVEDALESSGRMLNEKLYMPFVIDFLQKNPDFSTSHQIYDYFLRSLSGDYDFFYHLDLHHHSFMFQKMLDVFDVHNEEHRKGIIYLASTYDEMLIMLLDRRDLLDAIKHDINADPITCATLHLPVPEPTYNDDYGWIQAVPVLDVSVFNEKQRAYLLRTALKQKLSYSDRLTGNIIHYLCGHFLPDHIALKEELVELWVNNTTYVDIMTFIHSQPIFYEYQNEYKDIVNQKEQLEKSMDIPHLKMSIERHLYDIYMKKNKELDLVF